MDNFDFKKYLAESKLHENMAVEITAKIAQKIADAFTADDDLDLKYVVNPRIDAGSFDLDVEAGPNTPGEDSLGQDIDNYLGEFAGGSFYIKDGVVYNAAMRNAPVANVTPEGEVEMISAADSRAAIDSQDDIPAIDRMYNSDAWVQAQRDAMGESKEEKKSNKMKKSELKEMIRQAMLAETNSIKEQEEEVADEIEIEGEEETTEEPEIKDGEDTPKLGGSNQKILNDLEAALEGAKQMGDEKLVNQIGNTITFFTRQYIVKEEDLFEIKRMKRLAGILK